MEFFGWMFILQIVMQFFGQTEFETLEAGIDSYINIQTISLYVAAGLYLICLIMGGLGMMVMAKRVGLKNRWMGFVPFLNTYYAGKLAGETRIFNQKMKRAGLYTMIAEIVYVALKVFMLVIWFALMNPAYYVTIDRADGSQIAQFDPDLIWFALMYPAYYVTIDRADGPQIAQFDPERVYDNAWMVTADTACGILEYFVYFVLIFFMCILFYAFFRKYYARGPFLMTFLCAILPLRGFVIFAVRNNAPVDYDAWMRQRMQEYARQQQQMYGQGGYGNYGGDYGGNYGAEGQSNPPDDEPFSEFGDGGSGEGSSNGSNGASGTSSGTSNDDPFPDF